MRLLPKIWVKLTGELLEKTWNGLTSFYGQQIWTDGTNIYYSNGATQYVLDKETSTWSVKTWSGLTSFSGSNVWTDGTNIYYSNGDDQRMLDKATGTWSAKTWNGLTSFYGMYTWTDGTDIYYSQSNNQYVLDKATGTWSTKTWTGLTNFSGQYIWTDGTDVYYSHSSEQYVLDKATGTWSTKTWTGLTRFDGRYIWTDGTDIYYSSGATQYVLDKATGTWSTKTWTGLTNFSGQYIWTDGTDVYYSYSSEQYVLVNSECMFLNLRGLTKLVRTIKSAISGKVDKVTGKGLSTNDFTDALKSKLDGIETGAEANTITGIKGDNESSYRTGDVNLTKGDIGLGNVGNFKAVSTLANQGLSDTEKSNARANIGAGTSSFSGSYNDLTDKPEISSGSSVSIKTGLTDKWSGIWSAKTWTGLREFFGNYIWTDGTNIYYSSGTDQYVLDKATGTWSTKTWTGLTNFNESNIWTDGTNIYYSYGTTQYVLDKATGTWSAKTWTGLTNINGQNIWTDGTNIYYSSGTDQYVLDKETGTWSVKTWGVLREFFGNYIWTDGTNIYYSSGTDQYVLDKATSTWSVKTWSGLTNINRQNIWTDGTDIYYSYYSDQYVLDKETSTWSAKTWSGLTNINGQNIWTDGTNIYYSSGTDQYVLDKTLSVHSSTTLIKHNGECKIITQSMSHNIPRYVNGVLGKDITSYYQDGTLYKRLNGTDGFSFCEDIYIGDHFQMSRAITCPDSYQGVVGSDWVTIAGIDTLMGNGDSDVVNYHHLIMVPGNGENGLQHFGRHAMNDTNTTEGGYVGSKMHTDVLGAVVSEGSTASGATINQQLYAEFGSHLKTTRELLSNSINTSGYNRFGTAGGCSSNWGWTNCQAVLMSEIEAFGSIVWSSSGYDTGSAKTKLPLFAASTKALNNRSAWWWLKDVASAAYFCDVGSGGYAGCNGAGVTSYFVRPRFVLAA